MIQMGQFNRLKVLRKNQFGTILDAGDDGEILLPARLEPSSCQVGDILEVFVHTDSEDRWVATTETPKAVVGEFASLSVVSVEAIGAFLDWGLSKDLFLPRAEQTRPLRIGQQVVVFVTLDFSGRICATMKLDRYVEDGPTEYAENEPVDLLIASETDLGFKAIINGRHWGVLYANEIFSSLKVGQSTPGFIKKIRPDGKIDLSLSKSGWQNEDPVAPKILALLKERQGFLPIHDKTPAETIYRLFGVSKKKFKIALGGLYKKRMITVDPEGIRLV